MFYSLVSKFTLVLRRADPADETPVRTEVGILRLSKAHEIKFGELKASGSPCGRRQGAFGWFEPAGVFHCNNRSSWLAAMTAMPHLKWEATLAWPRTQTCVPP